MSEVRDTHTRIHSLTLVFVFWHVHTHTSMHSCSRYAVPSFYLSGEMLALQT